MSVFRDDIQHVLVLQGGGALGSYQAGAFAELVKEGLHPDYVAGISIGAINAAIIAGNRPEDRVAKLREFWYGVSGGEPLSNVLIGMMRPFLDRGLRNDLNAAQAMFAGVNGFYRPRTPAPFFYRSGTREALSFYETAPLRETLLKLVDFDYLNSGAVRFAVGAVNVETGLQVYFDNTEQEIIPEHIMASGALPPGFPPVEIDGAHYWDGGIVSNTPLQYILDNHDSTQDIGIYQFDLFDARGALPGSVMDIEKREKEIRFSSRSRYTTEQVAEMIELRAAMSSLYEKLPNELRQSDEVSVLRQHYHSGHMLLVQLIYRQPEYEKASKDYEFSRDSMLDHWEAGVTDAQEVLAHADWIRKQSRQNPFTIIDAMTLPESTRSQPRDRAA